jgi:hypothetical protein
MKRAPTILRSRHLNLGHEAAPAAAAAAAAATRMVGPSRAPPGAITITPQKPQIPGGALFGCCGGSFFLSKYRSIVRCWRPVTGEALSLSFSLSLCVGGLDLYLSPIIMPVDEGANPNLVWPTKMMLRFVWVHSLLCMSPKTIHRHFSQCKVRDTRISSTSSAAYHAMLAEKPSLSVCYYAYIISNPSLRSYV